MVHDALTTWRLLRSARLSSRRPAAWFRRHQEAHLRRLVVHAYEHVPLYRRLYDEAGFRPDMFRSLDDLPRIPPLSKTALREAARGEAMARGVDPATCQVVSTSGSTGMPLQIVLGRFERCWRRAVAWRILFEHGFRWTDRTLEIRMSRGRVYGVQRLGIAPKDWLSIMDPPEEWARRLARHRHACVVEVAAPTGEPGPLLVTALGMWTMPIIRYQTGDIAAWATAPCRCGRTLPVLSAVHGRSVDSITVADGRRLLWPFFHELLGEDSDILQWQVRQRSDTHLVVHVVARDHRSAAVAAAAERLRRRLPHGLHIDVQPVGEIPLEANGKRRLVVPLA